MYLKIYGSKDRGEIILKFTAQCQLYLNFILLFQTITPQFLLFKDQSKLLFLSSSDLIYEILIKFFDKTINESYHETRNMKLS